MKKFLIPASLALAILSGTVAAKDKGPDFLPENALDLSTVLAPPPADDSAETKAELAKIHKVQAKATEAEKKQAVADHEEDVFVFASALDPNFTAANLPVGTPFFARVHQAEEEFVTPAKKFWKRPRPPVTDPSITPCEKLSGSAAYPSGHSTTGYLLAIVLAQMAPEKSDAIFKRADQFAHNRVVCGVHYPSDVEAGRISAAVIASALMRDPAFQAEMAPARAEMRKILGLPAR